MFHLAENFADHLLAHFTARYYQCGPLIPRFCDHLVGVVQNLSASAWWTWKESASLGDLYKKYCPTPRTDWIVSIAKPRRLVAASSKCLAGVVHSAGIQTRPCCYEKTEWTRGIESWMPKLDVIKSYHRLFCDQFDGTANLQKNIQLTGSVFIFFKSLPFLSFDNSIHQIPIPILKKYKSILPHCNI